jgi:CBS domain-containing protein
MEPRVTCAHSPVPVVPAPLHRQSAILHFVHKHPELWAPMSRMSVATFLACLYPHTPGASGEEGAGGEASGAPPSSEPQVPTAQGTRGRMVVVVGEGVSAGNALHTLVSHKIWGLPVVDGTGAIVANFSVSDVKHLALTTNQADADAALALPVLEFLRAGRASTLHTTASPSLAPVVVCAGDTVSMAIQLLAESHLHHIYIVDGARVPVGTWSVTPRGILLRGGGGTCGLRLSTSVTGGGGCGYLFLA